MPTVKSDKLMKSVRSGEIAPIYFFYGPEIQLMRNTVDLIVSQTVEPAFEGFNLHRYEDDALSAGELKSIYETLPMMAKYRCITIKNWNLDKLAKQDLEQLISMLGNPNPSTVLVLYDTRQSVEPKKNAKYKKIYEAVEKNGVVTEFSFQDKAALKKAVLNRCQKAGVAMAPELCERLIEQCGSQYAMILNELDKLLCYAGENGTVTAQSMDLLCVSSIQNTAFDLSNAILKNRYEQAFSILDRLFYLRTEPVMILGALSSSFLSLYRVKAAKAAGVSNEQVMADFHYRSKYQIQKLGQDLSRFSLGQIRRCMESLEKADRLLKSSRLDNRIILEQMLGEMMAAR